jgi:hypothetical protein
MLSIRCTTASPSLELTDSPFLSHPVPDRVTEIAIQMGAPTVITLRNEDNVTHGFVSSMFVGLPVQGEGGIPVSADGRAGFHVDPGQILTLRFTPNRLGVLDIQCDIHPNMKGELLYLNVQPATADIYTKNTLSWP